MAIPQSAEIANFALLRLGADTIANLTEGSVNSGYVLAVYDNCVKTIMREHNWTFAIKRQTLAESAGTNNTPKTYMYQMPANCARLICLLDSDKEELLTEDWFVEGDQIYTDEEDVYAKFIDETVATAKYDQDFRWALALLIAWQIAMKITENPKVRVEIYQEYQAALQKAKAKNARSAMSRETEPTLWTSVH